MQHLGVPARLNQDADLLVSELVTDSPEHGHLGEHGTVLVRLYLSAKTLRIEIEDSGTAGAVAADLADRAARRGGFGLELVDLLATRWGVRRGHGTTVWFEMERPKAHRTRGAASATAIAGSACAPPTITFSAVRGLSSDAHCVPQRQHESSWRAIGARHDGHARGKCRSRMAQRSFVCDAGTSACISATFPSADRRNGVRRLDTRTALLSLERKPSVRSPVG